MQPLYSITEINDYGHQTEVIIDLMVPGTGLRGIDVLDTENMKFWTGQAVTFLAYYSHN